MEFIYRVVFVFGKSISNEITEVTVTHINEGTLQKLQKADSIGFSSLLY